MGFVRDSVGRITIESRRESFYIHDDSGNEGENPLIFPRTENPEVDYRALDDLIAALIELRDNDTRYAEWRSR